MEVYDAFRQITGIQIVRFLKIIGTYRYYVDIDQGIHKGKMKVALNEKRKKLHEFSFSINIANFEAFL